jgi:4a-hydroxytetrahydrobiopterin dehydratase
VADLDSLASNTVSKSLVNEQQLRQEVAALGNRWTIEGAELKCALTGGVFAKYGEAAAYAAKLADEMDHHPRIVLEYGGMTLTIHTHDAQAITVTDLVYAARLERWLRTNGWA